jgi:hypothetical protein
MLNSEYITKFLKTTLTDYQKLMVDFPSGGLVRSYKQSGKTYASLLRLCAEWMRHPDPESKRFYYFGGSELKTNIAEEEFNRIKSKNPILTPMKLQFRNISGNARSILGVWAHYIILDDYELLTLDERFAVLPIVRGDDRFTPDSIFTATTKVESWTTIELKLPYLRHKSNLGEELTKEAWIKEYLLQD